MDLFLAISAGIGVALASGTSCFLAALTVALLARAGVGLDLDGTDYEFLTSVPFIAAMAALAAVSIAYEKPPRKLPPEVGAIAAIVLGALWFAAALADEGYSAAPGYIGGVACALLGFLAVRSFVGGAIERLVARGETGGATLLRVYAALAAIVVAALAVLLPPFSYLPLVFCIWVLIGGRRRSSKKYEGLRVLR